MELKGIQVAQKRGAEAAEESDKRATDVSAHFAELFVRSGESRENALIAS